MTNQIRILLEEVQDLERRLSDRIQHKNEKLDFQFENNRPVFGADVRHRYKALKKKVFQFLINSSILKIITSPVVYSLAIPLMLLDLFVIFYQWVCMPVYGIPRVRRRDYVVIDRHRLPYLNLIEKFNCVYCGYANGVVALAREVASRTEQHWCPIKHARRVKGCHSRQCLFYKYGDAESLRREFDQMRADFSDIG